MKPASSSLRAFTLIEVVISAALMALILTSAYLCLNAGLKAQRLVEPRADIFQQARVALALLSADLRGACRLPQGLDFLGMKRTLGKAEADNLDFATHHYPPRNPREGDFCEVSYYLKAAGPDGRLSLWRRRNPTLAPDPLAGGREEELVTGVLGLKLEYFDGDDWYETWGAVEGAAKAANSQRQQSNLAGLPEAVRITLFMDSNPNAKNEASHGEGQTPPPLVFQTVACLNLADAATPELSPAGSRPDPTGGPAPENGGGN